MSVEVLSPAAGLITCKISGKLMHADYTGGRQAIAKILEKQGKARILVIAEDFQGWERGAAWGDISFQAKLDPHIERMAIVAEKQWEDLVILFAGKDLRRFPVEYFPPAQQAAAQAWLANDS